MAITQGMCGSFKLELLEGIHNFSVSGGDTFKMALYTGSAVLTPAAVTAYIATNESTGTGYTAGGIALVNAGVGLTSTTAFTSFNNATWAGVSISTAGALIYNSSKANRAVALFDFGNTYTVTAGTFSIQFPPNNSNTAVLILS